MFYDYFYMDIKSMHIDDYKNKIVRHALVDIIRLSEYEYQI